jgi:hypothetical protein
MQYRHHQPLQRQLISGSLKDLVTGDEHFIELKNIDPVRVRNFIRLLVTGNPHWIVPAGMEERRFAVLDCGEDHMQGSFLLRRD